MKTWKKASSCVYMFSRVIFYSTKYVYDSSIFYFSDIFVDPLIKVVQNMSTIILLREKD